MLRVYPDYYKDFRCIADKCRHNCCIGWEIDIDEDTKTFYDTVTGDMGQRLQNSIVTEEGIPHFVLGASERCPFLNCHNLCDIITALGEEHLCTICAEHPRFHNELPDSTESGLGLCCEEAARLILTKSEPVTFIKEGSSEYEDGIIELRDEIISILQNRSKSVTDRVAEMLYHCNATPLHINIDKWAELLLSLERLDECWTEILTLLRDKGAEADTSDFDTYMINRQTEYEQLLVYLIYRHFANAPDFEEAGLRAAFAAFCYEVLHTIGAVLWTENGEFTKEQQIDLCRMFSSEIEYSDENLYVILDELREYN